MLRFHLFAGSISGVPEYGCPDDPDDFEYLLRYSPYHRVKDGVAYPPVLLSSGDADTRCDPMHARKITARLQQASSSGKPVLLDYHESRGHASLLPLDGRIATLTNQFCFLFQSLEVRLDARGQMVPLNELRGDQAVTGSTLQ
jgi:prolyl oligopeptidase